MGNTKIGKWLQFCTLGLALATIAGSVEAGSIYSRFGIGVPRYYVSARAFAMGGAGVAVASNTSLNYINPAALSYFTVTMIDASALSEKTDVRVPNANKGEFSNTIFNGFMALVPLQGGLVVSLGMQPYSFVSYDFSSPLVTDNFQATQSLIGEGSLTRGFLKLGVGITHWLRLGVGADFYLGRIKRTWRFFYDTPGYEASRDAISSSIQGMSGHAGVLLDFGKRLKVGATIMLPANLRSTTEIRYIFGETEEVSSNAVGLPFGQVYGIAYAPIANLEIVADYSMQSWGSIAPEKMFGASMVNTSQAAVGFEILPTLKRSVPFYKRMRYRAGAKISKLPYLDIQGEEVNERFLTFGFSFPHAPNRSVLDFGFEFGKRGKSSMNAAEESIFRVVASITSGEKWFVRRD